MDKIDKWFDVRERRKAVTDAISSRNPESVTTALSKLKPEEVSTDQMSDYLQSAIDEQNLPNFQAVLKFVGDPNIDIKVVVGGGRYSHIERYCPIAYAIEKARTHDIALELANDPRTKVYDDLLTQSKQHGMQDVAQVLAGRIADNRRAEAAQLDKEAGKQPAPEPVAEAKPPEGETWARMSETSVAHVTSSKAIGRKMTEIFNFESKERTVITTNLETGVDTMNPVEKFETVPPAAVQRAGEMLKALNDGDAAQKRATFKL